MEQEAGTPSPMAGSAQAVTCRAGQGCQTHQSSFRRDVPLSAALRPVSTYVLLFLNVTVRTGPGRGGR